MTLIRPIATAIARTLARPLTVPGVGGSGSGPELISNGTFNTDFTGWSASNATCAVVAGELEVTATAASGRSEQTLPALTVGVTYRVTGLMRRGTSTGVQVKLIRGAAGSFATITQGTGTVTATGNQAVSFEFTAAGSDAVVQLVCQSTGTAYFDNISVRSRA